MTYQFDVEDATLYGVNEAVFLQNLRFWIATNKANKKNFREGRHWTYNSVAALQELYPFWTRHQIEHIVKKLIDKGVILKARHAGKEYDQTTWYAFVDEKAFLSKRPSSEKSEKDVGKSGNEALKNPNCSNTDSIPDRKPDKVISLHPSAMAAFCEFYQGKSGTSYIVSGAKDGTALKQLLEKVRRKVTEAGMEGTDEEVLEGFKHLLLSITDTWLLDHLGIALINSKFNEIFNQAKNGITTKQTQKGDISGLLDVFGQLDELYR